MVLESFDPWTAFDTYLSILRFPAEHPEFIPSLIPIFLGLVVIELYFGRYEFEELGWNSAVSNSVLIIATSLTLIVRLNLLGAPAGPRYGVAYGILLLGAFILVMNFFHVWPPKVAFNVSSGFVTYVLVYLSIALVYEGVPPTLNTVAASAMVFASSYLLFRSLKSLEKTDVSGRLRR
ncbi:MAG: hypothetical protein SVQ76_01695 [Candidatus Nanohaloarchaea archaeon]|nr:hypothetical protein [Candidatus Nanohaloarchaea archaeon]